MATANKATQGVTLQIGGQVQGVGFRPFVYRLAQQHRLRGWVENSGAGVTLLWQGEAADIETAIATLLHAPPPLARPHLLQRRQSSEPLCHDFTIRPSSETGVAHPHLPADYFVCDECLRELNDPNDRRYRYPFINCTQCGPRYTLIDRLPYDRANTSMAGFPLCPECRAEYRDPADRRFHAEPVACPVCGPQLFLEQDDGQVSGTEEALAATIGLLRQGRIVAVKGIGGFHLMCDARNAEAVARLRRRKARPHKPLAVMFPASGADGLDTLRSCLRPTPEQAQRLASPMRPIVLCERHPDAPLAEGIAPGLEEVGAMLPYSPLHHVLLQDFAAPLVATSGNLSGEPVLTDNDAARRRLAPIADALLLHDRPIRRPADDPLYRTIGATTVPLRLGRGNAPLERRLPVRLTAPLLAVGGEMKNSIALAWEERAVLSPHIGELHSPRGMAVFRQLVVELQQLYGVEAAAVVHDAHPGYHASRWARDSALPCIAVYHHHAHASAIYGEHAEEGDETPWLVATWDGVGYGPDGTLWGGEALLGRPGQWQRFAHLRTFHLPGGEKAGREPWRSALALCLELGLEWPGQPAEGELLSQAWQRRLNCPATTAAGRLFDAASALLGLCHNASFEGQAAMLLESEADDRTDFIELPLERLDSGCWQSDWEPLPGMLLDESLSRPMRAALFHNSLAHNLLMLAQKARAEHGVTNVGLGGGVFQNRRLSDRATALLQQAGFRVHQARELPCNDGALAWGQLVEAASRLAQ